MQDPCRPPGGWADQPYLHGQGVQLSDTVYNCVSTHFKEFLSLVGETSGAEHAGPMWPSWQPVKLAVSTASGIEQAPKYGPVWVHVFDGRHNSLWGPLDGQDMQDACTAPA